MTTWKDVWSRSGSKYQIRSIVLLAANVLLFAGVGAFAFWIRSGTTFAPTMEGYRDQIAETFRFTGERGVSLGSMLVEPINVEAVPMQIPILGLLMATLMGIPILVAILYRFWAALPFIAIVGFLAVMPWLAITLLGSCVIASVRPFRSSLRFVSALLGLIPAMVYLVLASAGTAEVVAGRIDPIDTIKFTAPWLLAIVAAALLFAVVLSIAKLVDYRPGALTPLLALMFGVPVILFEFHVGRDELHYRLLEALSSAHFEAVNTRADLGESARRAWDRHPLPRPRWQTVYETESQKWQMALAADIEPFRNELARHQAELAYRCDRYHKDFPQSRFVPSVLYLKARALDMRIDVGEFRRTGWIRFYDGFPSVRSRLTWRILSENGPDSELNAVALLRLAQLEARDGDLDRAIQRLDVLVAQFGGCTDVATSLGAPSGSSPIRGVFTPTRPEASLHISMRRVVLEAHSLLDLCTSNRDAACGDDPLVGPRRSTEALWFGLLDLDSRDSHYHDHVQRLRSRYAGCSIEDNLELEIAKSAAVEARPALLEAFLAKHGAGDAAAEAWFRLGAAYKGSGQPARGDEALARLLRERPHSIWTSLALQLSSAAASKLKADS